MAISSRVKRLNRFHLCPQIKTELRSNNEVQQERRYAAYKTSSVARESKNRWQHVALSDAARDLTRSSWDSYPNIRVPNQEATVPGIVSVIGKKLGQFLTIDFMSNTFIEEYRRSWQPFCKPQSLFYISVWKHISHRVSRNAIYRFGAPKGSVNIWRWARRKDSGAHTLTFWWSDLSRGTAKCWSLSQIACRRNL